MGVADGHSDARVFLPCIGEVLTSGDPDREAVLEDCADAVRPDDRLLHDVSRRGVRAVEFPGEVLVAAPDLQDEAVAVSEEEACRRVRQFLYALLDDLAAGAKQLALRPLRQRVARRQALRVHPACHAPEPRLLDLGP
jgi:hypothetical protein